MDYPAAKLELLMKDLETSNMTNTEYLPPELELLMDNFKTSDMTNTEYPPQPNFLPFVHF